MAVRAKQNPYPLEALLELREQKVESTTAELADAIHQRERAEVAREAAEEARRRSAEEVRQQRALEEQALLRGELTVADLARANAWEFSVEAKRRVMEDQVRKTQASESGALEAEERTRADLAQRKADADVVAKDRSRHLERSRKHIEAKEEENADEAWRKR